MVFPEISMGSVDELPKDGVWAVADTDRRFEPQIRMLHDQMQERLVIPEVWKELFPHAPILISSAISGGSLRRRFLEAVKERSCYLLLEPMRVSFPLPYPDGYGKAEKTVPDHGFFSQELLCYYAHFSANENRVYLWDTDETLQQKIQLAQEVGFQGIVRK